jgi:hypothetical protein
MRRRRFPLEREAGSVVTLHDPRIFATLSYDARSPVPNSIGMRSPATNGAGKPRACPGKSYFALRVN